MSVNKQQLAKDIRKTLSLIYVACAFGGREHEKQMRESIRKSTLEIIRKADPENELDVSDDASISDMLNVAKRIG